MTPAELNILINVRAKEARAQMASLTKTIAEMDVALKNAKVSFASFVGTAAGASNGVKMFTVAMADLSKALASISKSGAPKVINTLGANAALAATSIMEMAVATEFLNKQLMETVVVGNSAAAAMKNMAASSAGMAAAGAAGTAAGTGMNAAAAGATAAGAAATGSAKKVSTAGKEIQRFSGNWEQYAGKTRTFSKELVYAGDAATSSAGKYRMANSSIDQFGRTIPVASTNVRNLGTGMDQASAKTGHWSQTLGQHANTMTKWGSQMQWAGRQLSLYFTAPVALAIGMGTKWLLDLQRQQTDLAKVYGDDPFKDYSKDLKALNSIFREQSERLGISQTEITKIGAAWAQAGVQGKQLADATKLTAEAMIVGDQTADEALGGLVAVRQQWRLGSKDALTMQQAIADMNMASNITQVSFKDLPDAMGRVGATARDVGLSFQQTTAMITSLAGVTGSAATAGNGLKSILASLVRPTNKFTNEVKQASGGVLDLQSSSFQLQDPLTKLQQIGDVLKKLPDAEKVGFAADFGGKWQLSRALQLLTDINDQAGNFQKVMKATADLSEGSTSMKAYNKELQTYLDSNPQKFKIAGEKIRNSLMDVAIVVLPHIVAIAEALGKMAKAFAASPDWVQKAAIAFGVFLAVIGPLAMILGAFNVLFGTLGRTVAFFGRNFTKAGAEAAAAAKGYDKNSKQAMTLGGRLKATAKSIGSSSKSIYSSVTGFIGRGFKRAATEAAEGASATAAAAGAGARRTTAAWSAGLAGMGPATAAANASATAAQATGGARTAAAAKATGEAQVVNTRRVKAEEVAVWRATGNIIEGELALQGTQQQRLYALNGAKNVAAVTASQRQIAAATATGGAAATAAAGRNGAAAGAATATGAKKGFLRAGGKKAGGLLGTLLTVAMFIPPSFFTKLWGWIKAGFSKVFGLLRPLLERLGMNSAKGFGQALVKGLGGKGGWIGALVAVVGGGLLYAWGDIKKMVSKVTASDSKVPLLARPFVIGVKAIGLALSKLPVMVRDIFTGVVNMIKKAAMAIYKLFSYINPFAHHSPSLVENVQNGMAVVTSEFADASRSIQGSIHSAYQSISKFGKATAGLTTKASNIEMENTTKDLNRADPTGGAAKAYRALDAQAKRLEGTLVQLNAKMIAQQRIIDGYQKAVEAADKHIESMNANLERMQQVADATGAALEYAQQQLDYYSSAPLKGMQAMSDAIFENEMAQKKLQLQIMKLEDAGQSVDDLTDKYEKLQGQIESLAGERNDLQAKGAGSDILKTYDDQISALKKQQQDIKSGSNSAVNEITKLNTQLEALQRKGEELDLTNSLQFDPLTRQIEQAANATKEISFNEAIGGVKRYKAEVDILTVANNAANAAVQGQQAAIDGATKSRDALQQKMDQEQQKLDQIKTTYDQTSTAVDDTRSAMDNITSAASTVNQRLDEQEQAAKDAADAADKLGDSLDDAANAADGLGDAGEGLGDDLGAGIEDGLNNALDDLDIGGALDGVGDKIKDWFKNLPSKLGNVMGGIMDWIKRTFTIENWAEAASYIAGFIAGLIGKGIVLSIKLLAGTAKFFLHDLPKKFIEWIRDIDWGEVAYKIGEFLWKALVVITHPSKWKETAIGIVQGLLVGIVNAFGDIGKWVYDHIITPFLNGVKDGFGIASPSKEMKKFGPDIIQGLWNGITDKLRDAATWVKDNIVTPILNAVKSAFGINSPSTLFAEIGGFLIDGLFQGIVNKVTGVFEWFYNNLMLPVINAVKSVFGVQSPSTVFAEIGGFLIDGLFQGIIDKITTVYDWVNTNIVQPVINAVKSLFGVQSPSTIFSEIGGFLIDGLWQGMINKIGDAFGWIRDHIFNPITNAFKNLFGINSPSTVFASFGGDLIQGLINGVSEKVQGVIDWFRNLVPKIMDALSNLKQSLSDKFQEAIDGVQQKLNDLKDKVTNVFNDLPSLIGASVDKIRDAVRDPINVVIDTVYNNGIRRVWNDTAAKLPAIGEMPAIPHMATGGTVGNRIKGPGTGTSDSILTSATPGSEIFTAAEVRAAGGFNGLEKLLASMGVRGFTNSGSGGVPVALSNGEFKLNPDQIKQAGGMAAVKKLRASLDSGQIPGHDIGGMVKDVVTAPGRAIAGGARKAIAKAFEIALNAVGAAIPEGTGFDSWGKAFFDSVKEQLIDKVAGVENAQPDRHALGGTIRAMRAFRRGGTVPRFAAGGTTQTTSSGGSTAASGAAGATASAAAPGGTGTVDPGTGEGLEDLVKSATDASLTIWKQYYTATETEQTTNTTTMQAAQIASDAAMITQQQTTNTTMLAAQSATNATMLAADTAQVAALTNVWTGYRTSELASWNAFYSSQTAALTNFSNTYTTAVNKIITDSENAFSEYRQNVADTFNGMATDMQATLDGPITDIFNGLSKLLSDANDGFVKAVADITTAWSGLKAATGEPVNFTITNVYNGGLVKVWNSVAELIGANKMTEASPIAFREGGQVRGNGTETSDSIPAVLSRGEYVLSADAVRRAGGVGTLNTFNFGKTSPQGMFGIGGDWKVKDTNGRPKYATGGPTDVGSPTWQAFQRGHIFARKIAPGPYYLGGSSGGSRSGFTDCSGYQSEIADVIMGGPGGSRKWATGSFPGGGGAQGSIVQIGNQTWVKGLGAGHSIGISVPHAAGTLGGIPGLPTVNVESGGGTGGGATYGAPATGADDPQFPTQYHLAIVDGMFLSGGGAGASMLDILKGMIESGLTDMVNTAQGYQGKGLAGTVPLKTAEAWKSAVTKKIEAEGARLDAMGMAAAGGSGGTGNVEQWRPMVIAALKKQGFAGTKAEQDAMLGQIMDESGGNPNAINNWDSNAQAGHPSQGLLQTIPSTFESFRDPNIPGGITDPWANMNAALRYYRANYGPDLTTHWGRGKGGYDSGGWLPDTGNGYGTYFNHTGVPEAVLTSTQWDGIYAAASRPFVTVATVAQGFVDGMKKIYGINTDQEIQQIQAQATTYALEGQNKTWTPLIIDASEETTAATNGTTAAVNTNTKATYSTLDTLDGVLGINTEMSASMEKMVALMTAMSTSAQSITVDEKGNISANFSAFAPAITALGDFIGSLPDADPKYVSWAGTGITVTEDMKREKTMNDVANSAKGMYYAFKTIAPPVLKHTAIIGSAIEKLVQQDASGWAAATTFMASGNPAGYVIAGVLILKEILTLLPLIINAIMDIGPAIIESLIAYFTKFEPDSVYSYGTYDAANQAVNDNLTAIQNGATAPSFETVQQGNQEVNFTIMGDVNVNADSSTTAESFLDNLLGLAGI